MISVVIPALNEKDAIENTVVRAQDVLRDAGIREFEVVVVDDGSADDTGVKAAGAGARVVRHPHNIGYGRSLKDGIAAAQFDTIVIMDADGTYPIEEVPNLLEKLKEGFDMVVGARQGQHYRQSYIKMPLRSLLRGIVEFTAGRSIPDINSGLRVFRRSTVMPYYDHLCDTFSFTTSMTLAYMMTGRFVAYMPIAYHERVGRSKVRLFRDSLRTVQYVIESAIYYNPLPMFLLMALIVASGAFASFGLALLTQLAVFFFVGVGGIISAVLIFSMGLLAVLLRQIMVKSTVVPVAGGSGTAPAETQTSAVHAPVPFANRTAADADLVSR